MCKNSSILESFAYIRENGLEGEGEQKKLHIAGRFFLFEKETRILISEAQKKKGAKK